MHVLALLWWLVIGLVAGTTARLLVPGRQRMSLLMTVVLGLVGSLVGGLISWILEPGVDYTYHAAGLLRRPQGGQDAPGQPPFGPFKPLGHLCDDRLARQQVALAAVVLAGLGAGVGLALIAGEMGGSPLGVNDAHLADLLPLVLR